MKNEKNITISKIAELCGISRQVASAVLLGKSGSVGFSKETKKRVEEVARIANFRPNRTWLNATQNRHGTIGVLTKKIYSIPGSGNVSSIIIEAKKYGFLVTFEIISDNETDLPQFIKENVVDGLLMFEDLGEELDEKIRQFNIPAAYVNINNFERPGCINYDEAGLMKQLAKHFHKKGKKNIAFISASSAKYNDIRNEALIKVCKKLKMPVPLSYGIINQNIATGNYEPSYLEIEKFLNTNPQVDAIILERDKFALNLYKVLEKMNRSIPKDVSVISIMSDPRISYLLEPHLTSCRLINNIESSAFGTKLLCESIEKRKSVKSHLLEYEIIERGSV